MRVVFFGGLGHFSAMHLDAIARVHRVVGTFSGVGSRGARRLVGQLLRAARVRADPCGAVARRYRIRRWFGDRLGMDAANLVQSLKPDVICVAGYPWLLPADVWQQPPLGTLNCHGSLLPRHRGILPLFWIYYHNDTETGVTVHRLNERCDAGAIVRQDVYPLVRGFPVDRLNLLNAERGSRILLQALDDVRTDRRGTPQDESRATEAPLIVPAAPMVDFTWDVERVWHFLAGLFPRFIEPLQDRDGRPLRYGEVLGYERTPHQEKVGTISRAATCWHLFCDGGVVRVRGGARIGHRTSHA